MRVALLLVVLVSGCGPEEACTATSEAFAVCDADPWAADPLTRTTGARIWQCTADGRSAFTLCANGCTATGNGRDVCN